MFALYDAGGEGGEVGEVARSTAAAQVAREGEVVYSETELHAWYAGQEDAASFARRCAMYVPEGLRGKRVLDVNCRKGKGACKLADAVGADGFVVGIVLTPEQRLAASANAAKLDNVAFYVEYPERLSVLPTMENGAFDVVYCNASINVVYDLELVLRQVARVLKPGGLLVCPTVVASSERDADVLAAARRMGNCVQAALPQVAFEAHLRCAGFADICVECGNRVAVSRGANDVVAAGFVEAAEDVCFYEVIVTAVRE